MRLTLERELRGRSVTFEGTSAFSHQLRSTATEDRLRNEPGGEKYWQLHTPMRPFNVHPVEVQVTREIYRAV